MRRGNNDPFLQVVEVAFLHEIGEIQVLDRDDPPIITWATCDLCGGNDEYWGSLNGYQFAIKARQRGYTVDEIQQVLNDYWGSLITMRRLKYIKS